MNPQLSQRWKQQIAVRAIQSQTLSRVPPVMGGVILEIRRLIATRETGQLLAVQSVHFVFMGQLEELRLKIGCTHFACEARVRLHIGRQEVRHKVFVPLDLGGGHLWAALARNRLRGGMEVGRVLMEHLVRVQDDQASLAGALVSGQNVELDVVGHVTAR